MNINSQVLTAKSCQSLFVVGVAIVSISVSKLSDTMPTVGHLYDNIIPSISLPQQQQLRLDYAD